MFHFMNFVRPFVNYAIFRELCDRMRFEVDCAKSHHRVISEGLMRGWRQCSPVDRALALRSGDRGFKTRLTTH